MVVTGFGMNGKKTQTFNNEINKKSNLEQTITTFLFP